MACSTSPKAFTFEIAIALKEQNTATEQIAKLIKRISTRSEATTAEMMETQEVSSELKRLLFEMHQMVVRFRV